MTVGIQSPYLDTLGGGERYILTIAEFFLKRGDSVEILWDKGGDLAKMGERFGLDLRRARFVPNILAASGTLLTRLLGSRHYDLMVILSDGSVPLCAAKRNWIHLQVPFQISNRPKIINKLKLLAYERVLCNSQFTKKIIDTTFGIKSTTLYPPVDVTSFTPSKKENIILSVGRFFSPAHVRNFAPKKQKEMIAIFKKMVDTGLTGWELVLMGAAAAGHENELKQLRQQARGYPVSFLTDVTYQILREQFGKASIYWHAAGFGENLAKHPERAEHFGITTVEAMASGCVPIVFAGGGQKEIIVDGETGFFWTTANQLIVKTNEVIADKKLQSYISQRAKNRSLDFGKEKFYEALYKLA